MHMQISVYRNDIKQNSPCCVIMDCKGPLLCILLFSHISAKSWLEQCTLVCRWRGNWRASWSSSRMQKLELCVSPFFVCIHSVHQRFSKSDTNVVSDQISRCIKDAFGAFTRLHRDIHLWSSYSRHMLIPGVNRAHEHVYNVCMCSNLTLTTQCTLWHILQLMCLLCPSGKVCLAVYRPLVYRVYDLIMYLVVIYVCPLHLPVFNQGEEGTSWYIIQKGSVNVVIYGKVCVPMHSSTYMLKLLYLIPKHF